MTQSCIADPRNPYKQNYQQNDVRRLYVYPLPPFDAPNVYTNEARIFRCPPSRK